MLLFQLHAPDCDCFLPCQHKPHDMVVLPLWWSFILPKVCCTTCATYTHDAVSRAIGWENHNVCLQHWTFCKKKKSSPNSSYVLSIWFPVFIYSSSFISQFLFSENPTSLTKHVFHNAVGSEVAASLAYPYMTVHCNIHHVTPFLYAFDFPKHHTPFNFWRYQDYDADISDEEMSDCDNEEVEEEEEAKGLFTSPFSQVPGWCLYFKRTGLCCLNNSVCWNCGCASPRTHRFQFSMSI